MSAAHESLEELYSRKSDGVLLDMHAQGGYTDTAYEVLEEELRRRGIAVPPRPPAPRTEEECPQTLRALGKGTRVSPMHTGTSSFSEVLQSVSWLVC